MLAVFSMLLACTTNPVVFQYKSTSPESVEPDPHEPSAQIEPSPAPSTSPDVEVPEEPSTETEEEPNSDPDSGLTDTAETAAPITQKVRFVVLGDGGMGNPTQYAVSAAVEAVCAAKTDVDFGCEFALYLGDNIYDIGVDNVADPQFQTKFESPYANLSFPFYITLGNHDYGDCLFGTCSSGYDFARPDAQVEYTDYSSKWNLPDRTYEFVMEHVHFFSLDTNAIMWSQWFNTMDGQDTWLESEASTSSATWKIAFGHHPYLSNGHHGNAGSYDGMSWSNGTASDALVGTEIQAFIEGYVCGAMDIYLCGHDHNRQWLEAVCGTEFIVSGAASKLSLLEGDNPTLFEEDQNAGFLWVEIEDNCFRGEFYNSLAQLDFSHEVCK
jgi:tartrate-resistant acid phosphatase type 5